MTILVAAHLQFSNCFCFGVKVQGYAFFFKKSSIFKCCLFWICEVYLIWTQGQEFNVFCGNISFPILLTVGYMISFWYGVKFFCFFVSCFWNYQFLNAASFESLKFIWFAFKVQNSASFPKALISKRCIFWISVVLQFWRQIFVV